MNKYRTVDAVIAKWPELMQQTESAQEKELKAKDSNNKDNNKEKK